MSRGCHLESESKAKGEIRMDEALRVFFIAG